MRNTLALQTGLTLLLLSACAGREVTITDSRGTGREDLFRNLGALAPGTTFDVHFRVVDAHIRGRSDERLLSVHGEPVILEA